jgi:glutamyl/glutaminyl-tRNA synthetase
VRQSERSERHREAARQIGEEDAEGAIRFGKITLLRADGRPTYQLASPVDDVDLRITHVIRGQDHLPNRDLHVAIIRALGAEPPEYVHHGLLVGPDGRKLSKRHGAASLAELRRQGIPAEAVRAYLDELGLPRGDVHFDERRLRRLATEAIATLPDEELAARVGVDRRLAPALRGARNLAEAGEIARSLLTAPAPIPSASPETIERFLELRVGADGDLDPEGAKAILRELKAVGGDLRALRIALSGSESGPELWTVLVALPRDEALRRAGEARG